jgi:hypothetical protein
VFRERPKTRLRFWYLKSCPDGRKLNGLEELLFDPFGMLKGSFPITAGVDANVFEPATGLLFVSTREGMIHIFHEDSPDKLREVETVKTEYGAKTMGLDSKSHNLFVSTSDFDPPGAPTAKQPNPLPRAKPGNFRVLVYGK